MLNFQNKPLKIININKYWHILLKILPLILASKNDMGALKRHIYISLKRMVDFFYLTTITRIPLTSMPKELPMAKVTKTSVEFPTIGFKVVEARIT